jgi:tRNA (Thr-GGU) A37 N-methylase
VSRPVDGVLSTRSPHRPNPIELHEAVVTGIEDLRVKVRNIETIDGTPIVDLKPALDEDISRR